VGYLDDGLFILCCGLAWFLAFALPDVLSNRQSDKLKMEHEKTKQAQANAAAEASKLETKRLEQRQYNNYEQ
jgi:hypothetical protein